MPEMIFHADGRREVRAVPELPETVAEIGGAPDASATTTPSGAATARLSVPVAPGSADELIAELTDETGETIHECVCYSNEKERVFHIKELSTFGLIDVSTQRLQVVRGQIKRNPSFEAKMGLALELLATVVKPVDDAGVPGGKRFEPFFSLKSAQALLGQPKARDLVNELLEWIYTHNEALSPEKKVRLALAMG